MKNDRKTPPTKTSPLYTPPAMQAIKKAASERQDDGAMRYVTKPGK